MRKSSILKNCNANNRKIVVGRDKLLTRHFLLSYLLKQGEFDTENRYILHLFVAIS